MIDKLKRFETAEYVLPPFVGDVFKEEKDEQVLIQKLNISKSGILKMIQNLGAGAVAGTAAGAAVYAAEGASLSLVAHILVGLGLSSIPIAGPIIAAAAATATVAGVGISKSSSSKKKETNASYEDYLVFGGDMNDYGRRIAEAVFPPVIRYMRTDDNTWTEDKEYCLEDFLKTWGYSPEFRMYWQQIAKHASLEDIDMHINQVHAILDSGAKLFFVTPKILAEKSRKHMEDYKVNGLSEIGTASESYLKIWNRKNKIRTDLAEIEKAVFTLDTAKEKLAKELSKTQISLDEHTQEPKERPSD